MRSMRERCMSVLAGTTAFFVAGWSPAADPPPDGSADPATGFTLSSPAFAQGAWIPQQYAKEGKDLSPPLRWTDPPEGTKSLVLVCEDPDAPRGTWCVRRSRTWSV